MIRYLVTSVTAWAAVLFLVVEIALPYFLRRAPPRMIVGVLRVRSSPDFSAPRGIPFRERLRPHYWLGYALVALSTVHASSVGPAMSRSDATGIWAATFAWGLLFVQVALGLVLQNGVANAWRMRRIHFWSMLLLSALVVVHVLRNG
jgi:hypothetical protein